jgi:hypothetical protein
MDSGDEYSEFFVEVQKQFANYDSPAEPTYTNLLTQHIQILSELYQAVIVRSSNPQGALASWNAIKPLIHAEADAARAELKNVDEIVQQIAYDGDAVFQTNAYESAVKQGGSKVEAPDAGLHQADLDKAQSEFLDAEKFWEDSTKLMSKVATKETGVESIQDIIELVEMPGTIEEKLEKAKTMPALGQLTTVVELVGKIQGATKQILGVVAEFGERYCKGAAELALKKGEKELAEQIGEKAEEWAKLGKSVKVLATAATVASLIADGLSLLDDIRNGDWDAVIGDATSTGEDVAPLALGEDVAGPLTLVVVGVKVEMELLHEWAEIIRAINDEKVREAAGAFVDGMVSQVYPWAQNLVGNAETMQDASLDAQVQQAAQAQLASSAQNTLAAVRYVVGAFLPSIEQFDDVYNALGQDAIAALAVDSFENPVDVGGVVIFQAVIDRVQAIFHGTNLMGAYVRDHYKHGE